MNFLKIASSLVVFSIATCSCIPVYASFLSFSSKDHSDHSPILLDKTTKQIVLNQRIWSFDGTKLSSWSVQEQKKKTQYHFKYEKIDGHPLVSQLGASSITIQNQKRNLTTPDQVHFSKDGNYIQFQYGKGKKTTKINLQLKAYDISGSPISTFLPLKSNNFAQLDVYQNFPEGSIAYMPTIKFFDNQLVLPVRESFTNARNTNELIENFSKVPFCFSFENRANAQAFGILFTRNKNSKQNGTFKIIPVRKDTLFCRPLNDKVITKGSWNFIKTSQHSAVVLNIPDNIDPRDYGIKLYEKNKAQFAFIAPTKGDRVFRPGKFIKKGAQIETERYMFNETAARFIAQAIQ